MVGKMQLIDSDTLYTTKAAIIKRARHGVGLATNITKPSCKAYENENKPVQNLIWSEIHCDKTLTH
jgi:hypothetical protein